MPEVADSVRPDWFAPVNLVTWCPHSVPLDPPASPLKRLATELIITADLAIGAVEFWGLMGSLASRTHQKSTLGGDNEETAARSSLPAKPRWPFDSAPSFWLASVGFGRYLESDRIPHTARYLQDLRQRSLIFVPPVEASHKHCVRNRLAGATGRQELAAKSKLPSDYSGADRTRAATAADPDPSFQTILPAEPRHLPPSAVEWR